MSIEEAVVQKLRVLPVEKQRELLDFAEFLEQKSVSAGPRQSFIGLFADQGVHITEEDIDEARREMWGNFAREDV